MVVVIPGGKARDTWSEGKPGQRLMPWSGIVGRRDWRLQGRGLVVVTTPHSAAV